MSGSTLKEFAASKTRSKALGRVSFNGHLTRPGDYHSGNSETRNQAAILVSG
jgi:hypothetical protein